MIERVVQIAEAMLRNSETTETRSLEEILKGIHYFRVQDHLELVALVDTMSQFLANHPQVQLCKQSSCPYFTTVTALDVKG